MKQRVLFSLLFPFLVACLVCFPSCRKKQNARSRYEINVEYVPDSGMVTGTVKVEFCNTFDAELSLLKFQLYANAYRDDAQFSPVDTSNDAAAYYDGAHYGELTVSSVNGAKSWEIAGEDKNVLYAYLEQPLFPDDEVVLDVAYTLKLARVHHTTGVGKRAINLGYFFPILCGVQDGAFFETVYPHVGEPFVLDFADFLVRLTVPKDYEVCVGGAETSIRALESKKEHTVYLTNARSFSVVLSQNYRVVNDTFDGIALSYYHFNDKNADEVLHLVKEALGYYQSRFGAYPYAAFRLAQTDIHAAPSCTGLVMLPSSLSQKERCFALAQSIASQWWSASVGSNPFHNAWQGVGLSAYTAVTFFEQYEKYGFTREIEVATALKEYRSYYDVYGSVLGRTDSKMTRPLTAFISAYEYRCLEVDKAVVMFDTLRKSVGDAAFFDGLRTYYARCRFQRVTPAHLVGAFERVGLSVNGFFESFLEGKAVL